VVSLFIMSYII